MSALGQKQPSANVRFAPKADFRNRLLGHPLRQRAQLFFYAPRQIHAEDCTMRLVCTDLQLPAMTFDNRLANGKPNPATRRLGRKEWLEYAAGVIGCNTNTVIGHDDADIGCVGYKAGSDRQR